MKWALLARLEELFIFGNGLGPITDRDLDLRGDQARGRGLIQEGDLELGIGGKRSDAARRVTISQAPIDIVGREVGVHQVGRELSRPIDGVAYYLGAFAC